MQSAAISTSAYSQPRLEILELDEERIKFVLSQCHVSIANTLRRVMLAEVPTMAIHMVNIYENTSSLHDEYVAHRLGLIPLVSAREEEYKNTWECTCNERDQCQQCKVYFELNVQNTGQADVIDVTSRDIRALYYNGEADAVLPVKMYSPLDKSVEVGIPIAKLARNQRLNIKMQAEKGIGKMHAKWSPASVASFQYEPVITVREERSRRLPPDVKQAFVDCCPTKVFEIDDKTGGVRVARPMKCMFCGECEKFAATSLPINQEFQINARYIQNLCLNDQRVAKDAVGNVPIAQMAATLATAEFQQKLCTQCQKYVRDNPVKEDHSEAYENERFVTVKQAKDKFIFTVESTGALPPLEIVRKAFKVIDGKLQDFSDHIAERANMNPR